MSKRLHCIKTGPADKSALFCDPPTGVVLVQDACSVCDQADLTTPLAPSLPIKCETQVGLSVCEKSDYELIKAAAEAGDSVLFVLDITYYELADETQPPSVSNTLYQHQSVVEVKAINGEIYWNNTTPGGINPNAFQVNALTDNVGLSQLCLYAFN